MTGEKKNKSGYKKEDAVKIVFSLDRYYSTKRSGVTVKSKKNEGNSEKNHFKSKRMKTLKIAVIQMKFAMFC